MFVVNVTEGHMPHVKASDIEEERHISYVALTKARERLFATGYHNQNRMFSRFATEAELVNKKMNAQ